MDVDELEVLTVAEVALLLRCSPSSVRRAVRCGRLHAFQLSPGGPLRIPVRAVEEVVGPELAHPLAVAGSDEREPEPPVDADLLACLLAREDRSPGRGDDAWAAHGPAVRRRATRHAIAPVTEAADTR